jgi:hypothetical protein
VDQRADVDKPNTVNDGNEFEKPKGEPTPVHRFVLPRLDCVLAFRAYVAIIVILAKSVA